MMLPHLSSAAISKDWSPDEIATIESDEFSAMTRVRFLLHRFMTDIEELDEQTLARLVDSDGDLVASLCEQDGVEGALVSKAALDAAIRALVGVAAAPA